MKAAVLRRVGSPLAVEEVVVDRVARREVLVRTAAAGVCHSDLHFLEGLRMPQTPIVLGHEAAGVVEEVGADVTYVEPGDHVVACLSVFCGECDRCLSGRPYLCQAPELQRPSGSAPRLALGGEVCVQFANLSAFAEKMLVHERAIVKIDKSMPLDRAALIGCGVISGLGAVFRTAMVRPGQSVAVIGCGGVGLNAVQGAAMVAATPVIAVDTRPAKLQMAREFGATHLVDASSGGAIEAVRSLTGGGVDHAIEAAGLQSTVQQAVEMLSRGGIATVIGLLPAGARVEVSADDLLWEKRLQGCQMGSNRFRLEVPRYVELYLQGRLRLDTLISARIGLHELHAAFNTMRAGESTRTLIVFD